MVLNNLTYLKNLKQFFILRKNIKIFYSLAKKFYLQHGECNNNKNKEYNRDKWLADTKHLRWSKKLYAAVEPVVRAIFYH
jgi:hypothetical protein